MRNQDDILIVEDEAIVALDLEYTLESLGWRVVASLSGVDQALAWLRGQERPPAAALLDVNLGGQRVFPVAHALTDRKAPFVFVTGYADVVANSAFAGAPTLTKPVDPERLQTVLRGLVGHP